jgi:hypothetical protein
MPYRWGIPFWWNLSSAPFKNRFLILFPDGAAKACEKVAALLLTLLAISPLLDPVFNNFIPCARAGDPEESFLNYMLKSVEDFTNTELRTIAEEFLKKMNVPPDKIAEQAGELAVVMERLGTDTYTWEDIGLQYKEWAEDAIQILLKKGVISDADEAAIALEALQGARRMDAAITKATVLKDVVGGGKAVVDITGELGGDILVETKAVASNKAHTIAEMLRDIIFSWKNGRTVLYLTPNEPPPPIQPTLTLGRNGS